MKQYRLQTVGEGLQAAAYFTINEAKKAAVALADAIGEAVSVVEEERPKSRRSSSTYRRNPYGVRRTSPPEKPHTIRKTQREAEAIAQEYADADGVSYQVIDMETYPSAKAIKASRMPGKRPATRKASQEVMPRAETRQAPANKRRTDPKTGKAKSQVRRYSKLGAMSELFRRNPTDRGYPSRGEYYFIDPRTGDYHTGRKLADVQRAAQRMATQTGRRISVYKEDGERFKEPVYRGR